MRCQVLASKHTGITVLLHLIVLVGLTNKHQQKESSPPGSLRPRMEVDLVSILHKEYQTGEYFDGNHPGGLLAMMPAEFEMYEHHFITREGKLRNHFESLEGIKRMPRLSRNPAGKQLRDFSRVSSNDQDN